MTESKTPLDPEKMSEPSTKVSSSKVATKPKDEKKQTSDTSPNKVSKLAIFAVLIAIALPSGHYYWQQLQHKQLAQILSGKINEEKSTTLLSYQNQLKQALSKQQQSFEKQLQQVTAQIYNTSQEKITDLDTSVKQLEQRIKQRQPTDWLVHEAEYLIRIATRTLWLEHDTNAAIGLLKDADRRLSELNDPAFLPVRESIHQDVKSLELIPTLETDEVVLALIAMNKQVSKLPLAIIDLGKDTALENDLNLSNDINDWQTNLAKTWQKFLNDFIRVRQRTGSIEPLISPEQQENLKQNLSLKVQLALWAASERKGDIYHKTLDDIQQWLNEFFDMEKNINQHFSKSLTSLKSKQVAYDYPSELGALTAIRTTLRNQQAIKNSSPTLTIEEVKNPSSLQIEEAIKKAPTQPVELPEKLSDEASGENIL